MALLKLLDNLNDNSFTAEAYGLLAAAIFCKELNLTNIILEGDALQVVNMVNNAVTNWSLGGLLIEDARKVLNSFTTWLVIHTSRGTNMAAHFLAKDALNLNEDMYILEDFHQCIQSTVFFL